MPFQLSQDFAGRIIDDRFLLLGRINLEDISPMRIADGRVEDLGIWGSPFEGWVGCYGGMLRLCSPGISLLLECRILRVWFNRAQSQPPTLQ